MKMNALPILVLLMLVTSISAVDLGMSPYPFCLPMPGQSATTEIQVLSNPTENFQIQFNVVRLNTDANNVAFDESFHILNYGDTIPLMLNITMPISNPSNFNPLLKINASKVLNGPNNGSAGTLVAPEFSLHIIYGSAPSPTPTPTITPTPTASPTPTLTPSPTGTPGGNGGTPTPTPSPSPSPTPTIKPTIKPTTQPTVAPTTQPPSIPTTPPIPTPIAIPSTVPPIVVQMPSPSPTPQLVAGFIETKKSYIAAIILIIAAVVILASGYGKLKKKIKEGKMRETEENKPKTKA